MNLEFTGEVQEPYSGQGSPNTPCLAWNTIKYFKHAINVPPSASDRRLVRYQGQSSVQASSYYRHEMQRLVPKLTFDTWQTAWSSTSTPVRTQFPNTFLVDSSRNILCFCFLAHTQQKTPKDKRFNILGYRYMSVCMRVCSHTRMPLFLP
jgi:hypothetical protein